MSIFGLQHINQEIKKKLFELAYIIECFNKSGDTDISRYAETYFKNILNTIYSKEGWSLEKVERINFDTYDLYDMKNKVCIQITSNKRAAKLTKTISQFIDKGYASKFDTLVILFISQTKPNEKLLPKLNFSFKSYNIVEFATLIESNCNQKELLSIRDILHFDYNSKLTDTTKEKFTTTELVSEEEFLRQINLEKELKSALLIHEYWKIFDRDDLTKYPYKKFHSSRFILRSFSDETYPEVKDESNWERTFMYDFYDKGILIWIGALFGYEAIINEKEEWYVKDLFDKDEEIPANCRKVKIRILGKLPFKNIIHYTDGDDYYSDYHLFCKYYGVNNSPYDDIIFMTENRLGYFWNELDNKLKIDK